MTTPVYAFYGFKGGTGRSFVLAHLAALLASHGKKVLLIDADLEAPGLGDFYDAPGRTTFEGWRGADGLMDVMRGLAQTARQDLSLTGGKLKAHIEETLNAALSRESGSLVPLAFRDERTDADLSASLFGPGNHGANPELGGQAYVANFLNFDWNAFLKRSGPELLAGIGEYWRNGRHGFDHVLIDARTGYNLPSILMLQHWATHIVGVGTWSFQSIDGLARMLPVTRAAQGDERPALPTVIVMNKTPPEGSLRGRMQEIHANKQALVEDYFEKGLGEQFKIVELPFCTRLQANDRMVFSELGWKDFIRFRRSSEQFSSLETPDGRRNPPEEESLCHFVTKMGELIEWLTDGAFGLPDDLTLERVFDGFHPAEMRPLGPETAERFGTWSEAHEVEYFLAAARAYLGGSERNEDSKSARTSASSREAGFPVTEEERFKRLSKEGRALARHRLLTMLEEQKESISVSKARELQTRFAIGIDPTTAWHDVIQRIAEADKPRQDELTSEVPNEIYTAIRLTILEPGSDDWEEKVAELSVHSKAGDRLASLLKNHVAAIARETLFPLDGELARLAALARNMCVLLEERGPAVPENWDAFGKWNIFDLLGALSARLSDVLRAAGRRDAGDHAAAFIELGNVLFERLADGNVWEGSSGEKDFDHFVRCRFQWHEYLVETCAIFERADCRWPGLSAELADKLRGALSLPEPFASDSWNWTSMDRVETGDLDRFSQFMISLDLLALTEGKAFAAVPLVERLIQRALEHDMVVLHGNPKAPEPELRWTTCFDRLNEACCGAMDEQLGYKLARRMSRLLRHLPSTNSMRNAAGFGLSQLDMLDFYTHPDLWSKYYPESSQDEGATDKNDIFDAIMKIKSGFFRRGHDILDQYPVIGDLEVQTPAWWRYFDMILRSQVVACSQLGYLAEGETHLRRYAGMPDSLTKLSIRGRDGGRQAITLLLASAAILRGEQESFNKLVAMFAETSAVRARLFGYDAVRDLLVSLSSGDEIDYEATLARALARPITLLAGGPDEGACRWAGVDWNGSQLLLGSQPAMPSFFGIEGLHALALQGATRAGQGDAAQRIFSRWTDFAELSTLPEEAFTPIHHTQRAWLAAFSALYGVPARAEALRHRDIDLEENGPERAFAYTRIFELCGIDG